MLKLRDLKEHGLQILRNFDLRKSIVRLRKNRRIDMLNYIYRFLGLKKLTHRLFFWIILFLFLSSSAFLAIYVSSDRNERISRADAQLQRTLDNQQEIIESWADDRIEQISYLAGAEALKTVDEDVIYETFTNFTLFSLELEALFYVDENGDIVVDSTSDSIEPAYKLNLKDKPYFVAGEKGTNSMEDMYIRLRDETNVILFSSPVYDDDEQFKGIVLGAVNLNKINDLLKRTNLGITGETFIVNKDTELLLDVAHELEERKEVKEVHTAITDAIVHKESPPKTYKNTRGEEVLGHYKPLFDDLFYVIHEIKVDEVLKTHNKMIRTILMVGLVIIVVALLPVSLILKDIQKSIASFTNAIQKVREGNYEYKMDRTLYKSSSIEIQEAIDVFDSMTATIRDNKQELMRLSEVDPLTGVYNRRTFMSGLAGNWQEAMNSQQRMSILFIDIDYFKQLNDTFGHQTGDDVLIKITKVIEESILETTGTLYRYGGEEFIVLFPQTDEKTAYEYAETIRKAVERIEFIHENKSNVTVSIGVTSTIPKDLSGTKEFIQEADDALYQAKRSGRNQVQARFERK